MMIDTNKTFAVHQAAYQGKYEEVKINVLANNRLLTATDDSGRQPLHWAACGGHEELASFLIEHGAPVDKADDSGWSPLMIAASAGREEVVRLLIGRGANINTRNSGGHSALQYAASKNHQKIVCILMDNCANVTTNELKATLFTCSIERHLACEEERLDAVRLLLEHGASTQIMNKAGKIPLEMTSCPSIRRLANMNEM
nr:26S proteasome non-ATPase regulatory subunit 10-like [Cherax quadricarinatus]